MTTLSSKICVVGDFAVGKTSVCERFVNNHFSDKYLTTVGVKIDTKEVHLADRDVNLKLVLWDVAGSDEFGEKEFAYLRGAAGLLFVADGTRSLTVDTARQLKADIEERFEERPSILLLNKCDLTDAWEVSDKQIEAVGEQFQQVYTTSAKLGTEVEEALTQLARSVVDKVIGN